MALAQQRDGLSRGCCGRCMPSSRCGILSISRKTAQAYCAHAATRYRLRCNGPQQYVRLQPTIIVARQTACSGTKPAWLTETKREFPHHHLHDMVISCDSGSLNSPSRTVSPPGARSWYRRRGLEIIGSVN